MNRPSGAHRLFGLVGVVACVAVMSARSQAESPVAGGLPPPNVASAAALDSALAEFERSPDTVVAEIGSRSVTWGDLADAIRALPAITSGVPFQQLYQSATVQIMQTRALAVRAEEAGLDKRAAVQRRMRNAVDETLATEMLRRSLAPNLAEPAVRAVYDGAVAGKPGPEEVQLRLIVAESRDHATAVIQRLQNGVSFADLARDFSKDGTASSGGDLGFVRRDMLSPEVGAVAFALGVGQTTAYPVESGGLWFVIRVDGRRTSGTPDFDSVRWALSQDIVHSGTPALKQMALKDAKVTFYGLAGKKAK